METDKRCGTDNNSSCHESGNRTDFTSSFLKKLNQLQEADEDEEPVDNTQEQALECSLIGNKIAKQEAGSFLNKGPVYLQNRKLQIR